MPGLPTDELDRPSDHLISDGRVPDEAAAIANDKEPCPTTWVARNLDVVADEVADAVRKPRGRPSWVPPDLKEVENLAAKGLTMEQIAAALGIASSTLFKRKRDFAEFTEALRKGAAQGIAEVANKLYKLGVEQGNVTALIFYLKVRAGWRDTADPTGVNVNIGVGIGGSHGALEAEQREEKKRLARLMTQRERDQQLEMIRKLRERDRAQQAGEQPAIEVQARRIEDKNGSGSNGAGGE